MESVKLFGIHNKPQLHLSILLITVVLIIFMHLVINNPNHDPLPFIMTKLTVLLVALVASLTLCNRYFNSKWELVFFQPQKYKPLTFWIAIFYSAALTLIFLVGIYYSPYKTTLGSSSIFLSSSSIFSGLLFAFWGLLLTYHVLRRQRSSFVGFDSFLRQISDDLTALVKDRGKGSVTIYDYHPFVGAISAKSGFGAYKTLLEQVIRSETILVKILSYSILDVEKYNEAFPTNDSPQAYRIRRKFSEGLETIRTSIGPMCQSWASSNIGEFHFIIIDDVIYQYLILSEGRSKNNKNTIVGSRSEDVFHISQFHKTFDFLCSSAISAKALQYNGVQKQIEILFEPQYGINKIHLLWESEDESEELSGARLITNKDGYVAGFNIPKNSIKEGENLFYSLNQSESTKSPLSPMVKALHLVKIAKPKYIKYFTGHNAKPIDSAMSSLLSYLKTHSDHRLIKLTVFTEIEPSQVRSNIKKCFSSDMQMPPITVVCQTPFDYDIVIEASIFKMGIEPEAKIISNDLDGTQYTLINYQSKEEELYLTVSSESLNGENIDSYSNVLTKAKTTLVHLGYSLSDTVRHWHFVGEILTFEEGIQHYQTFNFARKDAFKDLKETQYPAASALDGGKIPYVLEIAAIKGGDRKIIPAKNQIAPYQYTGAVLPGQPAGNEKEKARPLFNRAMSIKSNNLRWFFISGTAAVSLQDSVVSNQQNSANQAKHSLDNVLYLLDQESKLRISDLSSLDYLRIHYNREANLTEIQGVLEPMLDGVPHVYLQCDICRDDLVVELDGGII